MHSVQMGDVVWITCAVWSTSKHKREQYETAPTYLAVVMSPITVIGDFSSSPLKTMELGTMSVDSDCPERN